MKKRYLLSTLLLVVILTACTGKPQETAVQGNGHTIVFQLNDSAASRGLYNQLPLILEVENHSSNEKIFYPPDKLDTGDTPLTEGGESGLVYMALPDKKMGLETRI